ncbi:ferritin-like domain-containing protein [Commensalibacter oyaizuii]|uniref:Ferritin-like domain-containing protein n=1 Tax=Commensalibacter oyaizuii TaxID=3043873 RepID=A0ABT6Q0Z1_9PROT|nr:ferritin-like domain-containing protein [Commensalibacter sp. TBRC 16381]MDI2090778.1 ferritin-like domain-containing protein [Commensalibacter sp. TBRC 16381]
MSDLEAIYSKLPENLHDLPQPSSDKELEEMNYRVRHWMSSIPGSIKVGSKEHKQMVAQMFRETFNPYRPTFMDWPKLSTDEINRLKSLPIWDIAVHTEGKARLRMAAYVKELLDPEMADAIARNAWEENRHKEVLADLVKFYDIPLASEPPYEAPKDAEWAYMVTGFSECWDSFFAFGLFAIAEKSGFFSKELVETFEPVMQEECRHILLFANWLAWHRANLSWLQRVRFELKVLAVHGFLIYERLGLIKGVDVNGKEYYEDNNFTINGVSELSSQKTTLKEFLQLCLDENTRRFAGYDRRLLRPKTAPILTKLIIKLLPKKLANKQLT